MFSRKNDVINTLRVPARKGGKYDQYLEQQRKKEEQKNQLRYIRTWRDIPSQTLLLVICCVLLYLFLTSYTFIEYVVKKIAEFRRTEDEL
jgi:hypothetical protein